MGKFSSTARLIRRAQIPWGVMRVVVCGGSARAQRRGERDGRHEREGDVESAGAVGVQPGSDGGGLVCHRRLGHGGECVDQLLRREFFVEAKYPACGVEGAMNLRHCVGDRSRPHVGPTSQEGLGVAFGQIGEHPSCLGDCTHGTSFGTSCSSC